MKKQIVLLVIAAAITACSSNSANNAGVSSAAVSAASNLSISPASITLVEGSTYPFSASGGSGTYTYSVPSGEGTVGYYTGYFTAPNGWTGTTTLEVSDSLGNTSSATILVTSSTGTTTTGTTTTSSVVGTLTHCVGMVGGYYSLVNNWQVNGTELRSVSDGNYFAESPIDCTGLSIAGSIPSNATIVGVSVGIFLINQSNSFDGGVLESMSLINSGSIIGNTSTLNQMIPGNTATFPTFTEGANGVTWGASLTPAIVNSASFGITLQTYRGVDRLFLGQSSSVTPQVTIYYSM